MHKASSIPPHQEVAEKMQSATHDLIATAQSLIAQNAPTLSPVTFHEWLASSEDRPFYTEGNVSLPETTEKNPGETSC